MSELIGHSPQTFRFYAGIPFLSILETEWRISGLSFLLLAGVPGELFKIVIFCILQTHRSVRLACSESMITEGLYAKSPGLAYLSELCMAVVNVR